MTLREQFFTELKASQSFKALTPDEQAQLLVTYEKADDVAFENGLKIIQGVEVKLQLKLKQIDDEQSKLARDIKTTLEQLTKVELRQNEAKDQVNVQAALADLEKQIDAL